MGTPALRTVVLDLDDTLLASAPAMRRARRALREAGVDPVRFAAADRRWWRSYTAGECTVEELRLGRFADCGVLGEEAVRLNWTYRELTSLPRPRRGARHLLIQLRELGWKTVILTNGTVDPQRRKVAAARFEALVDAVVITEEIGFHKPHPAAFAAALERVGGEPRSAAMVGDMLSYDVGGALAAGFARAVWLTTRRPHPDPRVATVRRLQEVLPTLLGEVAGASPR